MSEHAVDRSVALPYTRHARKWACLGTIVSAAKAGNYDLVVLGTHGRTGLPRVLLGSVAENVVRHAHCLDMSVRPEKTSSR